MRRVLEFCFRSYLSMEFLYFLNFFFADFCIGDGEHTLVICYGDEQFVSRLIHLMCEEGEQYGNILPFPGILIWFLGI